MPTELPKNYDPALVEPEADRVWMEEKLFHADPSDAGEPYCIVIPPPNVTGALHLGHALNDTIQDVLIRQHRMRGFNALWVPGLDHAGIATQAVVEKQLKENENKTRHDVGREGLVERIWAWKQQYGDRILSQLKRLGCSCDWDRTRFTLDDMCARAVRETFFKLFKDGLIYRGKRLVNWDVFLQTSISDDEIYHETVKTSLWHIKYPIEGTSRYMVVATTRPETMLGDTAVAVHSEDGRWNQYIGEQVRLPLTGRLIPIIADDILVDPKFGSGVVKVTPAHDPNDYAVWQRHQGQPDQIDLINILTPDGKINENGGPYAGLRRDHARKKVVEDLTAQGLLVKEEPYETQVGHSDRSKTPVEPYLSDQWFVKMAPLAEPALEVVREQIIKFFPARFANTYLDWLGEKRDWPISRQLWWGHRIPVWHQAIPWNRETPPGEISEGDDSAPGSPGMLPALMAAAKISDFAGLRSVYRESYVNDPERGLLHWYICLGPIHPEAEKVLLEYGFVQDPDVLDTWFSSALWPHSTLGWPDETAALAKWYPTSVLVTSRDIITLWVARMVMTGLYNMGHGQFTAESEEEAKRKIANQKSQIANAVPFKDVHIHTTILDGKGERMSKSKGNGVDPVDIIETHGADALRFTLMQMATETQDARLPVKKDKQGRNTSDKFDVGKHFCNKIWQVSQHFAFSNLEKIAPQSPDERKWSLAHRWIIARLGRAIDAADQAIATYRLDQYAKTCYDFFWGDFCDWYVEAIKPALRDPERAGQTAVVLAAVLDGALRLMHPVIPFITEVLFWRLNEIRPERTLPGRVELPASRRLIKAPWPKVTRADNDSETVFPRIQEIVSAIRNIRTQYNVNPKQTVDVTIAAPAELTQMLSANRELIELLATCSLKELKPGQAPPANAARTIAAGCELYLEGLVDPEAEQQVLAKKRADLERQIAAMLGRMANAAYIAKAPPELVQQTREQLAAAQAELQKLTGG